MQFNIAGMFLNVEPRFGFGFDIESVESRPVWTVKDGELSTMAFDGLVLLLPFFIVTLGNVWTDTEE
tara:strand:+ start:1112 stop:1312 length:201 start_codon:yes stop_codon:yes gene_type:complete